MWLSFITLGSETSSTESLNFTHRASHGELGHGD